MFTVEYRDRVRDQLIAKARSDTRLVAAAAVGGSAGEGDRWSDLDLTFAVAGGASIADVLADWTQALLAEVHAVVLFDLPFLSTIYRVFILPGMLQVDLSFTPAAEFAARGPRFRLLFGEAVERPFTPPPSPESTFGLGIHHAVRARICIERSRLWQAEYWIHDLRDQALTLACLRRGVEASHGRGFDGLPPEVLDGLEDALVTRIAPNELGRALAAAIAGLLREAGDILDERESWFRAELEGLCRPEAT
jgi:hypothetical protein